MKIYRKYLLWLFVGLLSLGQLQRVELSQQFTGINIYFHELFILIWISQLFFTDFTLFTQKIYDYFKNNIHESLFLSILIFSLGINIFQTTDYLSFIYFFRFILYILFGFSISYLIEKKEIKTEYFRFQLFSVGIISLFLGFLQYIFITDTRFLSVLGWDDHYARLISTYFDPGFTGIIFLITLLLGISNKYISNKYIKLLIIFIFSWGIILTFSRATYSTLIVALCILTIPRIKFNTEQFKKSILGIISFAILLILAPKPYGEGVNLLRTASITARVQAISHQVKLISPQILSIGNGPFSQKNSLQNLTESENLLPSHSRVPDNIFINVLLSSGLLGTILFILLLIKWGRILKKNDVYIFASFVAVLLHSQFSNSLLQPFVLIILLGSIASIKTRTTN